MSIVTDHPEGATLEVRAQPGARKNAVLGRHGEFLKIAVTAPPEDGRANEALRDVIRKWIGARRSQVELITGLTHREKVFLIRGMSVEELNRKIEELD
jgi:uncharacterized protein (TIGR00251 family)